jgi:nitrite reductase/ring-hydroxylating ferredoxin subunit
MFRRVLVFVAIALVVALGAAFVIGIATNGGAEPVASLEALREQDVLFLEEHHIFLVFNDGDPLALSDDAQHVGDRVEFCRSSQMLESQAHGEKFDIRGLYYGGPSERGLDRYPVRIEGDRIFVELDQRIEGPRRNEQAPTDPQGRFCIP